VLLQQAGADKDVFTMKEVRNDLTAGCLVSLYPADIQPLVFGLTLVHQDLVPGSRQRKPL
jgi:hypothetical protein